MNIRKLAALLLAISIITVAAVGCARQDTGHKLDPKNPVTISVWHYYNGSILNAFESLIQEFNETVGMEQGVIVESYGMGNVSELEAEVMSAANKEIGSMNMPNIFASYADTAYAAEKLGLLANLGDYFSQEEQAAYMDSYIDEGKIGLNGELRIFPVAKATEILLLNDTDWQPFATANNLGYSDLYTIEGITRAAALYYEWTDAKTPDIANDGKSFFGRDSMANLFIIASKEFGTEIFKVENGAVTITVNPDVMRKIWNNYYVPYISGYYSSYGRFRSDDAKVGDILAYVGATTSATYFPSEVTTDEGMHPVEAKVLPAPHFAGAEKVMVQQGAGMVVTKSTPQEEYASVLFLKWFTETENNISFAALSGYMPVKKEAVDYSLLKNMMAERGQTLDPITNETLRISIEQIGVNELYTNKAFDGGAAARAVLENNLQEKAVADREAVLQMLADGATLQEAVANFNTTAHLNAWIDELSRQLNATQ